MIIFLSIVIGILAACYFYFKVKKDKPREIICLIVGSLFSLIICILVIHLIWMTLLAAFAVAVSCAAGVYYVKYQGLKDKEDVG